MTRIGRMHWSTRCMRIAEYIIDTGCTVRDAAKAFDVSKPTAHTDVAYRLNRLSPELYRNVSNVLARNKSERSYRGGLATKHRWSHMKTA